MTDLERIYVENLKWRIGRQEAELAALRDQIKRAEEQREAWKEAAEHQYSQRWEEQRRRGRLPRERRARFLGGQPLANTQGTEMTTDNKLTSQSINFLRLLLRSPDAGEGWRKVSTGVWPLVELFEHKELLEIDREGKRVRLSEDGLIVVEYMT